MSRTFALCVWALLLVGCATRGQLKALQGRVVRLERERAALAQIYQRDQKRLARLRQEIETSSAYLRRNGARINARVDDLQDALRRLKGQDEVAAHQLKGIVASLDRQSEALQALLTKHRTLVSDLRDRAGISVLALPRQLPTEPTQWVGLAIERFGWGEVRVAAAVAQECRKRFRGSTHAATCGLLLGKIAFEEHRFADAVVIFRSVHDARDGKAEPVVADALLNISKTFEAQGKCKQSKQVLGYVKQLMKRAPKGQQAAQLLTALSTRCVEGRQRLPAPTSGALKRAVDDAKAEASRKRQAEDAQRRAAQEAASAKAAAALLKERQARAARDKEEAAAEERRAEQVKTRAKRSPADGAGVAPAKPATEPSSSAKPASKGAGRKGPKRPTIRHLPPEDDDDGGAKARGSSGDRA